METSLKRMQFPELFFGVVAPVGVDIQPTLKGLTDCLKQKEYTVHYIKTTKPFDLFRKKFKPHLDLENSPYQLRIDSYIRYGNQLRWNFRDQSILAASAIYQISRERAKIINSNSNYKFEKNAFIVHQFKRKEEIELMRAIYGRLFSQVSIYANRENRIDFLARKMASEASSSVIRDFRPSAEALVNRDQDEAGEYFGQRVSKVFHEADFIISNDCISPSAHDQIKRIIELQFGSNSISPTKSEYGMFLAKSAALRSLDLSRQVGAAIFSPIGEIISLGSNEVPKADGGTYWSDEEFDDREYSRGYDTNDRRKEEILRALFKEICEHEYIDVKINFDQFIKDPKISSSRFMDALEYGRVIHAEMSSIMDAARLGRAVKGSNLYCTTFPCHMCAKHIVAAGISNVIFLEPYPKSLAEDLHSDAIRIEGSHRGMYNNFPSVKFEHFFGVTPRNYISLFSRGKRKNNDIFQQYKDGKPRPLADIKIPIHVSFENKLLEESVEKFKKTIPKSSRLFDEEKKTGDFR